MSPFAAARRYPLLAYFLVAYSITWGGVLALVGPGGLRSGQLTMPRGMLVWAAMLAGPSVAGVWLTFVVSGRDGWRDFRRRLTRWRIPARWYAPLLVAPVIGALVVGVLALVSQDFAPWVLVEGDTSAIVVMFVALVLGAAVEELGWTGYATPRMRRRFGLFRTALLLGALHGAWHFLADFSGRADAAPLLYVSRFVIFWTVGLIALRLLMVWAYEHTESLLLGQLIHASYTAPLFLLTPPAASAVQLLLLWTSFTVVFAAVVVVLVRTGGRGASSAWRQGASGGRRSPSPGG
jgi:uncharacterized protein